MNRPTVTQAQAWRPESLRDVAEAWDRAALDLQAHVDAVLRGVGGSLAAVTSGPVRPPKPPGNGR